LKLSLQPEAYTDAKLGM